MGQIALFIDELHDTLHDLLRDECCDESEVGGLVNASSCVGHPVERRVAFRRNRIARGIRMVRVFVADGDGDGDGTYLSCACVVAQYELICAPQII